MDDVIEAVPYIAVPSFTYVKDAIRPGGLITLEDLRARAFSLDEVKAFKEAQWPGPKWPGILVDNHNHFPVLAAGELRMLCLYWVTRWAVSPEDSWHDKATLNGGARIFLRHPLVPLLEHQKRQC